MLMLVSELATNKWMNGWMNLKDPSSKIEVVSLFACLLHLPNAPCPWETWGATLEARGSQWKGGEQLKATKDRERQVWSLFPVFLEDERETCPALTGILRACRCDPPTQVLLSQSPEEVSFGAGM